MFTGLILLVWVALIILVLGAYEPYRPYTAGAALLLVIMYILISHGGKA